jgi:hypothetical protein
VRALRAFPQPCFSSPRARPRRVNRMPRSGDDRSTRHRHTWILGLRHARRDCRCFALPPGAMVAECYCIRCHCRRSGLVARRVLGCVTLQSSAPMVALLRRSVRIEIRCRSHSNERPVVSPRVSAMKVTRMLPTWTRPAYARYQAVGCWSGRGVGGLGGPPASPRHECQLRRNA